MFLKLGTTWLNMDNVLRIVDHAESIPPTTYIYFVGEHSFPVEGLEREKLLGWLGVPFPYGMAPSSLHFDELIT